MSRSSLLVTALLTLPLVGGCIPPNANLAPQTAREAVTRINKELSRIDGPIYAKSLLVSFRLRDGEGRQHLFVGGARFLFEGPRCLWFNIEHGVGGTAANIGSNDERYWITLEVETPKLWWGSWEALEAGASTPLMVPPDQLLDALMVRPLPMSLSDGPAPLLVSEGYDRHLLYMRFDPLGWPYVARRIILKPSEEYWPSEIIDYDAAGAELMRAQLWGYKEIGGEAGAPRTPRHYIVRWSDDTQMNLDLAWARYNREVEPPCDFPSEWNGPVECLDQPRGMMPREIEFVPSSDADAGSEPS